jgi:hypothetical protein
MPSEASHIVLTSPTPRVRDSGLIHPKVLRGSSHSADCFYIARCLKSIQQQSPHLQDFVLGRALHRNLRGANPCLLWLWPVMAETRSPCTVVSHPSVTPKVTVSGNQTSRTEQADALMIITIPIGKGLGCLIQVGHPRTLLGDMSLIHIVNTTGHMMQP